MPDRDPPPPPVPPPDPGAMFSVKHVEAKASLLLLALLLMVLGAVAYLISAATLRRFTMPRLAGRPSCFSGKPPVGKRHAGH